jgi:hypothetical protein
MNTVNIKEDFEKFYLITWGIVIGNIWEAQRFLHGAKIHTGLSIKKIIGFLEEMREEGVVMSEEVELVSQASLTKN